ncbi:amidohydrolase [Candidatus Uabimicrobium amorphum]|uniref:5-methylthioadenosine/S-adenosylhomocysteine deaminase n=1 Tax=Uabimicrobium amorphum TaxID=2596890 RepID=A0A5S9ILC1_UABAM|nr:amidohydrolase [Candidatus Uabimicrobium amorphum]BBM83993.1 5-methylthioadenosine/S-adenosylhomocysteinedeaminase [Candidatus Uabimicrobium amorphum]
MDLGIENVVVNGQQANIYVEGNKIAYIGQEQKQAQRTINGKDKAAVASIVNGHTHAAMTLFRGYGDDMKLQEWLEQKIWPMEAKLTPEEIYWGTKLACLEMIKCGVTLFNDMYWHNREAVKAVEEMGMRAFISEVFIDIPGMQQESCEEKAQRALDDFQNYSSRIHLALGPHAIYTCEPDTLKFIASFAKKHNLPVHFHLSETQKEIDDCVAKHGKRPVPYLDDLGFLHSNLFAAHCVWLDNEELDLLAKHQVKIIHNPIANFKLAVNELLPYPGIKDRDLKFCLGTDGCASNNNLDIFEEIKFAALVHKWKINDPTIMNCNEIWSHATKTAHEMFGVNAGEVSEGKYADFLLVDLNHPQMVPCHNLVSNLVYAGNGSIVDTVICDGKIVMENRHIPGEEEIISQAKKVTEKLFSR